MYSLDEVRAVDPEIAEAITDEMARQNSHIELIASENWVSKAVMAAMGSPLTNKYAEGYSGKRYYGGCECVDVVEDLAIARAKELFGCESVSYTHLINDLLDDVKKRMPECETTVRVANSSEIEQAILDNEVDLGIVEGILKSKDLLVTPVCEDEVVVVCGKDHRLANEEKVTLDMLEGQDYISRESGSTERNQIEKIFEDQGIHLKRIFPALIRKR